MSTVTTSDIEEMRELENIRKYMGSYMIQCLANEDCIYGEFAREWAVGSASKTANLAFRHKAAFDKWRSDISNNWSYCEFTDLKESSEDDDFKYETWKFKYTRYSPHSTVTLKVKYPKSEGTAMFSKEKRDIDINQLKLDRMNNTAPASMWSDLNSEALKVLIKKRMYTPLENFNKDLEKQLAADGWRRVETKKGTSNVSNSSTTLFDRIKDNAEQAAYKSAATQVTKLSKAGVVHVLEKYGQKSDSIQSVADLMDTKGGKVILAMAMGMGLQFVPKLDQNERVQRLADTLCQNSMSEGANSILESVFEHLSPVFENVFAQIPEEEAPAAEVPANLVQEVVEATVSAARNA